MIITLNEIAQLTNKLLENPLQLSMLETQITHHYEKSSIQSLINEAAPGCANFRALLEEANKTLKTTFFFFCDKLGNQMVTKYLPEPPKDPCHYDLVGMLCALVKSSPNEQIHVEDVFETFKEMQKIDFYGKLIENGYSNLKEFLDTLIADLGKESPLNYGFLDGHWYIFLKGKKSDDVKPVLDEKPDAKATVEAPRNHFTLSVPAIENQGKAEVDSIVGTINTCALPSYEESQNLPVVQGIVDKLEQLDHYEPMDQASGVEIIVPNDVHVKGLIMENRLRRLFEQQVKAEDPKPIDCCLRTVPIFDITSQSWSAVLYEKDALTQLITLEKCMDSAYEQASKRDSPLRMDVEQAGKGIICAAKMLNGPCQGKRRRAIVIDINERTEQAEIEFIDYLERSICDVENLFYLSADCAGAFVTAPVRVVLEKKQRHADAEIYSAAMFDELNGKNFEVVATKINAENQLVVSMRYRCIKSSDILEFYQDVSSPQHIFSVRIPTKPLAPPVDNKVKLDDLQAQLNQLIADKNILVAKHVEKSDAFHCKINEALQELQELKSKLHL